MCHVRYCTVATVLHSHQTYCKAHIITDAHLRIYLWYLHSFVLIISYCMGVQVLANSVLLKYSINVLIILHNSYINFWQIHSQLLNSLSFPTANHLTIYYYSYKYFLTTDLCINKPVKQRVRILKQIIICRKNPG